MGFTSRAIRSQSAENPSTPWDVVAQALDANYGTAVGIDVNEHRALSLSTVYACVRVIAETVAALPGYIYREKPDGSKAMAKGYPLYDLIHNGANPMMNSFVWRELVMIQLLLWGNSYNKIEENADGSIYLWPLQPEYMTVDTSTGKLLYVYKAPMQERTYQNDEIFHIKGLTLDGYRGQSVISYARNSVGLGLATEEYGGKWFGNGARPGGIIENPQNLSAEAMLRLRRGFEDRHGGIDGAHRVAVLQGGATYKQIQIAPNDSQFLQTRAFQVEEICRWFRVSPRKIMHPQGGATSIEEAGMEFVQDSIQPWCYRLEAAFKDQLLGLDSKYFVEFDLDALQRGNITARYNSYALGTQWGFLVADDIRKEENLEPLPGGDVRLVPMNMTTIEGIQKTVSQIGKQPPAPVIHQPGETNPGGTPPKIGAGGPSATAPGTNPVGGNGRSLAEESKAIMAALKRKGDIMSAATAFYETNGDSLTRDAVIPAIEKGGDRNQILARVSGVLGSLKQKDTNE